MKTLIASLMVLVISSGAVSASDDVLVFEFKGIGVDYDLIQAVTSIFVGALAEEGRYQPVFAAEVVGDAQCYDVSCAADLSKEAGYDRAVTGTVTRLGSKLIVRVQLVDAGRKEITFSDDGVSQTEDDLDVVLSRLAKSLSTGKKMEDTAEVGLITEKEYDEVRRRESYSTKSFNAGFLWPTAGSFGGVNRLITLDLAYHYDTTDFFLTGRSSLRWGGDWEDDGGKAVDVNFLEVKIGRYFSRNDFSPFVNAGIGIHYVKATKRVETIYGTTIDQEDGGTGPVFLAGGGFTAFRTYNFHFRVDVDYMFMLEKINTGAQSGDGDYPQGIIFTFCVMKGQRE